jgi:hypothetical protein
MCPLVKVVVVEEGEILFSGAALEIYVGGVRWHCREGPGNGRNWRWKMGEVFLVGQGEDLIRVMLAVAPVGTIVGELNGEFLIGVDMGCLNDIEGIPV